VTEDRDNLANTDDSSLPAIFLALQLRTWEKTMKSGSAKPLTGHDSRGKLFLQKILLSTIFFDSTQQDD